MPEYVPSSKDLIVGAFLNLSSWAQYFDMVNDLFEGRLLHKIHDAKTLSVASEILQLSKRLSCSVEQLHPFVCTLFDHPSPLRLSNLVDLYSSESFALSLAKLQRRYLGISKYEPEANEIPDLGVGTLPLFGPESYLSVRNQSQV